MMNRSNKLRASYKSHSIKHLAKIIVQSPLVSSNQSSYWNQVRYGVSSRGVSNMIGLERRNSVSEVQPLHHHHHRSMKVNKNESNDWVYEEQVRNKSEKLSKKGEPHVKVSRRREKPISELSFEEKLQYYDVWKKNGHKFSENLYKEFLTYSMIMSRQDTHFLSKSFEIANDLVKNGFKKDQHVYLLLLQSCARSEQLEKAFEVSQQMEKDKVPHSQQSYVALIRACAVCGSEEDNKERALEIWNIMKEKKLAFDSLNFDKMFHSLRYL